MSSATGLARFPDFQSDPTASLVDDFRRLALQEGWSKKSNTYKEERRAYLAESVENRFLTAFGVNAGSLQAWQSLCRTIGVTESVEGGEVDLTSIRKCQALLKGIFVNLVDLVEAASAERVISKKFSSHKALARYIRNTGKYFPRERAKRNPLLRRFLITVVG